jgi:hypothetical protein
MSVDELNSVSEAIERTAKEGVQRATADGVSVDAIDIEKQIAADKYLRAQTAASRNHLGLSFRRIVPGGCG